MYVVSLGSAITFMCVRFVCICHCDMDSVYYTAPKEPETRSSGLAFSCQGTKVKAAVLAGKRPLAEENALLGECKMCNS